MAANTYRVALIGTGGIAEHLMRAIRGQGERVAEIAAVNPNRDSLDPFCDREGIGSTRRYTDFDTMLVDFQPQVTVIVTPPAIHADLCIRSMRGGAHVLCEKPICGSLAELDAIQAAERETGKTCSSVVQWRFGSAARHVRGLIQARAFGDPLLALSLVTWYRPPEYYAVEWRGGWHNERGGVTLSLGVHAMDMLLWLLSDWESVRAIAATRDRAIEVDNISLAHVQFASGAYGSFVNSAVSPLQRSVVRLDFQRATVELTHLYHYTNADWTFTPAPGVDAAEAEAWRAIPGEDTANHGVQFRMMLDSLDRGETPLVTGGEIRRTMDFVTSLYKSAFTGQPVARGSVTPDDPFYHAFNGKP